METFFLETKIVFDCFMEPFWILYKQLTITIGNFYLFLFQISRGCFQHSIRFQQVCILEEWIKKEQHLALAPAISYFSWYVDSERHNGNKSLFSFYNPEIMINDEK